MKIILTTLLLLTTVLVGEEQVDFLSPIKTNPALAKSVGLQKLTAQEQQALNQLLNRAYQIGTDSAVRQQNPAVPIPGGAPPAQRAAANSVYLSRISENNGNVLNLENGAIVEVTGGFLGFIGIRKSCALYQEGRGWRISIEGKRDFSCSILKAAAVRPNGQATKISVSEVLGDGKFLKMLDGSLYEVDDLSMIDASLWLAPFDALLIDGNRLINLDEGGETVDVSKVR
jgi:hypothetical protein